VAIRNTFNSLAEFQQFEEQHPPKGFLFQGINKGILYDISTTDFNKLVWLQLDFGAYKEAEFHIAFSEDTYEFFVADMNTAGHGARCRIIKIDREKIYTSSEELIAWNDDWARQMWSGTADKAILNPAFT